MENFFISTADSIDVLSLSTNVNSPVPRPQTGLVSLGGGFLPRVDELR